MTYRHYVFLATFSSADFCVSLLICCPQAKQPRLSEWLHCRVQPGVSRWLCCWPEGRSSCLFWGEWPHSAM